MNSQSATGATRTPSLFAIAGAQGGYAAWRGGAEKNINKEGVRVAPVALTEEPESVSHDLCDLPDRPPDRPGFLCELTYTPALGGWSWRYRRPDDGDLALARIRQDGESGVIPMDQLPDDFPHGARPYEHGGRIVGYVELAAIYRAEKAGT